MIDEEFLAAYLAIYNQAVEEGKTVETETLPKGTNPTELTLDGRRIVWIKKISLRREKEVTWIGVGEKKV